MTTAAEPAVTAAVGPDALDAARRLVRAAGLPALDGPADVLVAWRGGVPVGTVAVEGYGADGLLRSLAVDAAWRGRGVGRTLVAAAERRACGRGLESLALLTTTAAPFFAALGWREADRAEVPAAVRASSEFCDVCPASAACFVKRLSPPRGAGRGGASPGRSRG